MGLVVPLTFLLLGFAGQTSRPALPPITDSTIVRKMDSNLAQAMVEHWHWTTKRWFGGSFPGWAVPGTFKNHAFFFQGSSNTKQIKIRIQRHPPISKEQVEWANAQHAEQKGFSLFVQQNWGFEIDKTWPLGKGKTVAQIKKELTSFFKAVSPIIDRLCGGKDDP